MTRDTAAEPCLWRCGEVSQVIDVTRVRACVIRAYKPAPPCTSGALKLLDYSERGGRARFALRRRRRQYDPKHWPADHGEASEESGWRRRSWQFSVAIRTTTTLKRK